MCRLDPDERWCTGCGRLLAEIAGWATASEEEKRTIVRMAGERRAGVTSSAGVHFEI
ncbi:DUF1289 domain-containing protein [Pseudopontixanthobacter vadosimaris]|uniref:DUF1289 domain-containing protein n=1 Tax=Pseudopontixanthobacter vadosimaris TaxID=2726450 RepID=UPI0030B876E8